MVNKLPFDEFSQIYHKVPRLFVDLVIADERGVVLSKTTVSKGTAYAFIFEI